MNFTDGSTLIQKTHHRLELTGLSPVTKLNSVLPHSGQFSPTARDIRTFGGGKLMLKHFLVELFLSSGTLTKVLKIIQGIFH